MYYDPPVEIINTCLFLYIALQEGRLRVLIYKYMLSPGEYMDIYKQVHLSMLIYTGNNAVFS